MGCGFRLYVFYHINKTILGVIVFNESNGDYRLRHGSYKLHCAMVVEIFGFII